jgi:hypothetical protein
VKERGSISTLASQFQQSRQAISFAISPSALSVSVLTPGSTLSVTDTEPRARAQRGRTSFLLFMGLSSAWLIPTVRRIVGAFLGEGVVYAVGKLGVDFVAVIRVGGDLRKQSAAGDQLATHEDVLAVVA